jgi:hypothetical protein
VAVLCFVYFQYIEGVGVNLYQVQVGNESLLVGRRLTDGNGMAYFKVDSGEFYVLEVNETEYSHFISREIDPSWHWFGLATNSEIITLMPSFWDSRFLNNTEIWIMPGTTVRSVATQIAILTTNDDAKTIAYSFNGTTLQTEIGKQSGYAFRPETLGITENWTIDIYIDSTLVESINFTLNPNLSQDSVVNPDDLNEQETLLVAIFLFIGMVVASSIVSFATAPDGKGTETFSILLLLLSPFWSWFAIAGLLTLLKIIINAWKVFTE